MFFEYRKMVSGRNVCGEVFDIALDAQETEDDLMQAIADAIASQVNETVHHKRFRSGWLFKVESGRVGAGVRKVAQGLYEIVVSRLGETANQLMRLVQQIMAFAPQPLCELEIDPNDYLHCIQVRQGVPTPPPLPAGYLTWDYPQG